MLINILPLERCSCKLQIQRYLTLAVTRYTLRWSRVSRLTRPMHRQMPSTWQCRGRTASQAGQMPQPQKRWEALLQPATDANLLLPSRTALVISLPLSFSAFRLPPQTHHHHRSNCSVSCTIHKCYHTAMLITG